MTTALFSLEIVGCIVYLKIVLMFKNYNRLGKTCIAITTQACENVVDSDPNSEHIEENRNIR